MYNDATLMNAIVDITKRSRPRRGVAIPDIDNIWDTRTDTPPAGWWERAQAFIATQRGYRLSLNYDMPPKLSGATSPISVESPEETPDHDMHVNGNSVPAEQFGTTAHEFSHVLSGDVCMTNEQAQYRVMQSLLLGTSEIFESEARAALVEQAVTAAAGMTESPVNLGYLMGRQDQWETLIDQKLIHEAFLISRQVAPILIGH